MQHETSTKVPIRRMLRGRVWCGPVVFALLLCQCTGMKSNQQGEGDGNAKKSKWTHVQHVLRSTVYAAVKAPVATAKIGSAMLYERTYSLLRGNVPLPRSLATVDVRNAPPGSAAFEALLDHAGLPQRSCGKMELLIDGPGFFPAFLKTVNAARQRVDIQFFLFDNDDYAIQVADALRAKSRQVPMRILIDGLGTDMAQRKAPDTPPPPGFLPPRNLTRYLEHGSGIQVRRISDPFFVVDHTKVQIVDGQHAFTGGMNIGREYRSEWHDMMVKIEGPVVHRLQRLFDRAWENEAWGRGWNPLGWFARDRRDADNYGPAQGCPPGTHPMRLLRTDAISSRRDVLRAAVLAIRAAQKRVWIESPYYTADDITPELTAAAARGVDVRVIIPKRSDFETMTRNNYATARTLMAGGVRVFEYPKMTHVKATLCDDWALVGSANYDMLSLRLNGELNLAVTDPPTVRQIATRVFQRDFHVSKPLTPADLKKGSALAEFVGDQL